MKAKTILDAEKKDAIDIATELCYSEDVKRQNPFTKLVAFLNMQGSIKSDISERRNHANIYWRTAEWKDYHAHRNV